MKVHCDEGVATHIGPKPCAGVREDVGEASAGEHIGQPLSRETVVIPGRHWMSALAATFAGLMAATGASAQQHVLNMLVLSEDSAKIGKVADAYQARRPDVAIKVRAAPWDQYFQTAELRLGSKDKSVDLVYVDVPLIASYASRGFLAPVDPGLDTSALVPSSLDAGKYEGKLYALPIKARPFVALARSTMMATRPDCCSPLPRYIFSAHLVCSSSRSGASKDVPDFVPDRPAIACAGCGVCVDWPTGK